MCTSDGRSGAHCLIFRRRINIQISITSALSAPSERSRSAKRVTTSALSPPCEDSGSAKRVTTSALSAPSEDSGSAKRVTTSALSAPSEDWTCEACDNVRTFSALWGQWICEACDNVSTFCTLWGQWICEACDNVSTFCTLWGLDLRSVWQRQQTFLITLAEETERYQREERRGPYYGALAAILIQSNSAGHMQFEWRSIKEIGDKKTPQRMSRTNANSDQQNRQWTPRHSSTCHVKMQIMIDKIDSGHQDIAAHVTYKSIQWSTKDEGHRDTSMSRTNVNSDQQNRQWTPRLNSTCQVQVDTKTKQHTSSTNANNDQQKTGNTKTPACHVQMQIVINKPDS